MHTHRKGFRICSVCNRKLTMDNYWSKGRGRRSYTCKFCFAYKIKQKRMYEKLKKKNKKQLKQQCKNKDIILF